MDYVISADKLAESFERAQKTAMRISSIEHKAIYVAPEMTVYAGIPMIVSFCFEREWSQTALARAENGKVRMLERKLVISLN